MAAVVAAVGFLAGCIGYVLGGDRRPERGSVDVGFLHDMLTHHEQAVVMSNAELVDGQEPAIAVFAREILHFQSYEIGLMQAQLDEWGYERQDRPAEAMTWMGMSSAPQAMPGMASEAELRALQSAEGRHSDALFVQLMQDHHAGGVHMAETAAADAADAEVRELAKRMARNQRMEIAELEAARGRAALPADPPGYGS
jgi:uncharacterized protein (DUF305 family)